jgi:RNA polymerase sigma factor (sigma-70 family)
MMTQIKQAQKLRELMSAAQNGDRGAYGQLLGEITPLLRATIRARRNFLQKQEIEDIVQDILLSLHTVRATYDPQRPFLPWLMAILRNRMADAARRHLRRAANEVNVEFLPETFFEDETNIPGEAYRDPVALKHAIGKLPSGQREAVEMLKLREMSLKEASAASGKSISSLKVSVHRAIISLRKMLTIQA